MSDLDPEMVEVTPFGLDADSLIPLSEAEACLSDSERARAHAFRFPIHQERYIRGRAMMRHLLAGHLGTSPDQVELVTEERGKPHLRGGELHFNLSHSGGSAVLAISRIPSIGIDIECFDRAIDVDGLSRRCFRPAERRRFAEMTAEEKQRAFFWTWTAKEARMKATGEGFRLEPQRIEIAFSGEWPEFCLEPRTPLAYVRPVVLPGWQAACTVAAMSPFDVSVKGV
jgi:4'-phosphopantetheinyl transferase